MPTARRTWADVNPALPATPILVIGPPPTSGTRDSFNELYLIKGCETEPAMQALQPPTKRASRLICSKLREDGAFVEGGENDNLIVQKIAANPRAIGVFGYSFLEENLDRLKDVPLGGVEATYENIAVLPLSGVAGAVSVREGAACSRRARACANSWANTARNRPGGRRGYLSRRGLVASPDAVRARNAAIAANLIPLDPATL